MNTSKSRIPGDLQKFKIAVDIVPSVLVMEKQEIYLKHLTFLHLCKNPFILFAVVWIQNSIAICITGDQRDLQRVNVVQVSLHRMIQELIELIMTVSLDAAKVYLSSF